MASISIEKVGHNNSTASIDQELEDLLKKQN